MGDYVKKIAELPPLDIDAEDDAAFRAKDRAWSELVRIFDEYQDTEKLTYVDLGRRIRRSRAHVQRWLSSPFNMSLKSLGLLAEGLNSDLVIRVVPRTAPQSLTNYCHPSEEAKATIESRTRSTWSTGTERVPVGSLVTAELRSTSSKLVPVDA